MKKIYFTFLCLLILSNNLFSATRTSAINGAWSASATWGATGVPQTGDDVIIAQGTNVTLDVPASIKNLTIYDQNGTTITTSLTLAKDLTITGNVTMVDVSGMSYGVVESTGTPTITFGGTSIQYLSGQMNGITAPYNVIINNPNGLDGSSGSPAGSTSGTLTVINNITITSGMVTNCQVFLSGDNATVSGETSSSYIQGDLYTYYRTVGTGSCNFGNMGALLSAGSVDVGSVKATRSYGQLYNSTGISVYWKFEITQSWSESRTITLNWLSAFDGSYSSLSTSRIYRSTDFGNTFIDLNGANQDASARTISALYKPTQQTYPYEVLTVSSADQPLPVELTSFTANANGSTVSLNWQTATEVNNYGFEILRFAQNDKWEKVAFVQGHGNSNSPKSYSFVDANPQCGVVQYRLKQIDFDGKFEYSNVVQVSLAVPAKIELKQNHPNPFNPETIISYQLSAIGHVSLKVYDLLGREVVTLVDEIKQPGVYNSQFSISNYQFPSGVYFYTLRASNYVSTKKMILMK